MTLAKEDIIGIVSVDGQDRLGMAKKMMDNVERIEQERKQVHSLGIGER